MPAFRRWTSALDAQIDSLRAVGFGLRLADCFGVDPWYLAFGEGSGLSDRFAVISRRLDALERRPLR
jgi:hypothetical protein